MDFFTYKFWIIFFITLLSYYLTKLRFRWVVLTVASVLYCLIAGGLRSLFLFITIGSAWLFGYLQDQKQNKVKIEPVCFLILFLNIGLLCFSKLMKWEIPGISYYTFIAIGYMLDVQRKVVVPEMNYAKIHLFISFFPQLVSGPINQSEGMKNLFAGHHFEWKRIMFGFQRILWGVLKKMVIADRIALLVNTVFGDYQSYNGLQIVAAIASFTIQLYMDFSGCIDIAIGIGEVFGVRLPENFDLPFLSASVSEFWRRWHITLGLWLKEYLFYPLMKADLFQHIFEVLRKKLGKKTAKKCMTCVALLILWFTVGLWHGTSLYMIWGAGLIFGCYIISAELLKPLNEKISKRLSARISIKVLNIFRIVRTCCFVSIGMMFMRAEGVLIGFGLLRKALTNINIADSYSLLSLGLSRSDLLVLAIVMIQVLITVCIKIYHGSVREYIAKKPIIIRWAVYYMLIFEIIIWGQYGVGYDVSQFIYKQF